MSSTCTYFEAYECHVRRSAGTLYIITCFLSTFWSPLVIYIIYLLNKICRRFTLLFSFSVPLSWIDRIKIKLFTNFNISSIFLFCSDTDFAFGESLIEGVMFLFMKLWLQIQCWKINHSLIGLFLNASHRLYWLNKDYKKNVNDNINIYTKIYL